MIGIENGIGLDIILWFQSWRTPLVESVFTPLDFLGSVTFYLVLLPLIYWSIDQRFGRRLSVLFLISSWSNLTFKEWWQRPRPFQVSDQVRPLVEENTFGLPSGDTQFATVVWGAVARRVRRSWVTVLVVLLVLLIMLERMILGVHFPQDVIGGALLGLLWLAAYVWLEPRLSAWVTGMGLLAQIGLVAAVTAVMLLVHPVLTGASNEEVLEFATVGAGAFLGLGVGFALETRGVRFDAGGALWQRAARFALGVAVLFGLRVGLGAAFEGLEPLAVFLVIRFALIGLWMGFGAPWVFVKLGLAGRAAA